MAKLKSSRVYGNLTVDDVLLVSTDATITGNLTVLGTTTTVNSTTVQIEDPIVRQGALANGAAPNVADGKDRGLQLSYYDGSAVDAFLGYLPGSNAFTLASNATISNNVVTVNKYGNLDLGTYALANVGNANAAGLFTGDAGGLGNITGGNVTGWVAQANVANTAGYVTGNVQGNITSLGTLTSLSIDGGNLSVQNASIITSGSITANGTNSNLTIGTSGANNSVANIYGDLNVTGNVSGRFTGSVAAKGANTQIQFNDDGNQNATSGFTFVKTSNTVTANSVAIGGDSGNISVTGVGRFIGSTGVNVKATTGAINLTADGKDLTIDNLGVSYYNKFNVNSDGNLTAYGYANIGANLSTGAGNFTVDTAGNVDAKRGNFTSIKDTGLTDNQLVFTTSNVLGGSTGLTYTSNTLNANNFATTNANISGNITTSNKSGNLLVANATSGNIEDSNVSMSGGMLTVTNANIIANLQTANLQITGLSTANALLFTTSTGNVTENSGLTYTGGTLTAGNLSTGGTIVGANVQANNIQSTQIAFAGTAGLLQGNNGLEFFTGNTTLVATNITSGASGTVYGNVLKTNISTNKVTFLNGDGNLVGSSDLEFYTSNATLVANNFSATNNLKSANAQVTGLNVSGGVVYTDVNGNLQNSSNIIYTDTSGGSLTLTSGNITANIANITNMTVSSNLSVGNVKTDNLLKANGAAWDFNMASGSNTYIQYKMGNDLSASANFTYNDANTLFTVTGNANVTGLSTLGNVSVTYNVTADSANVSNVANISELQTANIYSNTAGTADMTITAGNITLAATGHIDANNKKISNIASPTSDTDAATKGYVDGLAQGLDIKASVRLSTGSDINLSTTGLSDIDGVTPIDGDRVLVKAQTIDSENGIYVAHDGAWTRSQDAVNGKLSAGSFTFVEEGTDYHDTGWVVSTNNPITVGTTSIAWTQFSAAGTYSASTGLTLTGTAFSISNTAVSAASYGTGDAVATFTVNSQGQLTAASNTAITANAANLSGTSLNSSIVGSNLTSVGTLANLSVTGNITGGNVYANSGTIGAANLTGTLTTNAQPNITSVGNLTSLGVTNRIVAGNIASNNLTVANGLVFTNSAGNLADDANITFDAAASNLTVNGNIITGGGSGGNITGANVVSATSFTSTGGTIDFATNNANVQLGNVANIHIGGGSNGYVLQTDGVGNLSWTSAPNINEIENGNSNVYVNLNSNVTINANGGTNKSWVFDTSGNLTGPATGSANLGNLVTASYFTGTLTTNAQPNITSVGTLANLSVTGNITSGNANLGNLVTASYFTGTLTTNAQPNITSVGTLANLSVTGNITSGNANLGNLATASYFTGTLTTNAQPNITSVGTLANLSVTGNVVAGNIASNNLANTQVVFAGTDNILTSDSGLTYTTVNTTLTANNITASSSANLGNVANITLTGGSSGQYLRKTSSDGLEFASVDSATIANGTSNVHVTSTDGNVDVNINGNLVLEVSGAGANVTGIITATGNITGDNIISNNAVIANSTTDATSAVTGAIKTAGGISAQGNIYTGHAIGFANTPGSNTSSAAYIQFNSGANSLDFIFN